MMLSSSYIYYKVNVLTFKGEYEAPSDGTDLS